MGNTSPIVINPNDTRIELYCGDAIEMAKSKITDGTVDLIFTDPPYSKAYHFCYEWLAKEAARVLKPSGFLISYAGPYWKDVTMGYFGEHLQYFYDFVLIHRDTTMLWQRKVISGYKSLLCYHQKGQHPLPRTNVLGKWIGVGKDKRFHAWGQDEGTSQYYIGCFSKEGDLVVDYFLGGGTTAINCKRLNRQFIGFEKDEETFKVAQSRIDGTSSLSKSSQSMMDIGND